MTSARRWRSNRQIAPHIARLRAIRALGMSAERFDRLIDGRLIPAPGGDGFDVREVARRAHFISTGSAGAWSAWCWSASKPAAEVRRIIAAETRDLDRLRFLLERMLDTWRLGLAARRPRDPSMEYRVLLNALRLADAIRTAGEALGHEPYVDDVVERSWIVGAA